MRRVLLMIVIMMLIGCNDNGGGEDISTTPRVNLQPVVVPRYYEEHNDPIEIYLDDLSFSEAFRIQHRAKGEGQTFWWHENEYTTNLLVPIEDKQYPSVDAE